MNGASALMYIDCFLRMMKGECFKRGTSEYAINYYVEQIAKDFGEKYQKNAVQSVKKHHQYLKSINHNSTWMGEWLVQHGA